MSTRLKDFLLKKMKMTGPYQPMIIRTLLAENGEAEIQKIAQELAKRDPSAIEYYSSKLLRYPREVLAKHQIAVIESGAYKFQGVDFSEEEKSDLLF